MTEQMKLGQKLDVEIRSPVVNSKVRINGHPVRVRSIKVEAVVGEPCPLVTLVLFLHPGDDPITLSGLVVTEKKPEGETPLDETVPE